jgi:hypothetical protein
MKVRIGIIPELDNAFLKVCLTQVLGLSESESRKTYGTSGRLSFFLIKFLIVFYALLSVCY